MVIVESILGNIKDDKWGPIADKANIDWLNLNQWDAQKNRFRRETENKLALAVSLERNHHLSDGDILSWDPTEGIMVVARITLRDVMVIYLKELVAKKQEILIRTCIEIGHALGNQHWPAVVKEDCIYVPLTVDKKVMLSVMRTHAFQDVTYEFIPAQEAIPYLLPHESRRLFGGAEQESHSHPAITSSDALSIDAGKHEHRH